MGTPPHQRYARVLVTLALDDMDRDEMTPADIDTEWHLLSKRIELRQGMFLSRYDAATFEEWEDRP